MQIRGIYFRREFKRVYPHGRLASNILGFVGIDGRGLEGVEYNYNSVLTGVSRDGPEGEYGLKRGDNVWLTIDAFVQHVSEQEITKAVISHGARQGAVIVMDVKSGRLLALGKYPGYNPNRYYDFTQFERRSYSVIDAFEPGSTMKIIALASLLENGKHVLNKTFSCSGSIDIGDATINCTGVHGDLGMDGVITMSCNVGIITAMKSISKNEFYQSLLKFGFEWKVYRIRFEQPINFDLVCVFDFFNLNLRNEKDQEILFLLAKEGLGKNAREDFYEKVQSVNRYVIGNLMLAEPVLSVVRRELRKIADGMKVEVDEVESIVRTQVLKREIVEGEEAEAALARVNKFYRKGTASRRPKKKPDPGPEPSVPQESVTERLLREAEETENNKQEN